MGDIAKMYHSVRLSQLTQHTHRFVWRDMYMDEEPDHYILTSVTFGDRCSGATAVLAMKKTTEMQKNKFPEVNKIINKNTYVDDILYSVESVDKALEWMKNVEKVLSHGGFRITHWVVSGEIDHDDSMNILDTGARFARES